MTDTAAWAAQFMADHAEPSVQITVDGYELARQTGDPWDDEFINSVVGDMGYINYIGGWLPRRLAEVNAERQAQGLGVLMEDDGVTPVACVPFNPYG